MVGDASCHPKSVVESCLSTMAIPLSFIIKNQSEVDGLGVFFAMDHSRLVVISKGRYVVCLWLQEIALLEQLPPYGWSFLFPSENDFLFEWHFRDHIDEAVLGLDGEGATVTRVEVEEKMPGLVEVFLLENGVDVVLDDLGIRPEALVVHAVVTDVSGC